MVGGGFTLQSEIFQLQRFDKVDYRNVGFFNAGRWGGPRRVLFNLQANF